MDYSSTMETIPGTNDGGGLVQPAVPTGMVARAALVDSRVARLRDTWVWPGAKHSLRSVAAPDAQWMETFEDALDLLGLRGIHESRHLPAPTLESVKLAFPLLGGVQLDSVVRAVIDEYWVLNTAYYRLVRSGDAQWHSAAPQLLSSA